MAYTYKERKAAEELYIEGYNISEIHNLLKINRGTLHIWKKKYDWDTLKSKYELELEPILSQKDKHKKVLENIIAQSEYLLKELS